MAVPTAVPCPALPTSALSNPPSNWSGHVSTPQQMNAYVVDGSTNVIDCVYDSIVIVRRTMPAGTVCTATSDLKGFSCK